jgi:signal transduction histidine kinase/DNA-binding response OmpR family regulator/ligand-binding sensor domain-containing protein
MRNRFSYFTIYLIALLWKVNAQSNYRFEHFDTDHGLANEFVMSIAQDSLGFIWAQFAGGLSRFDGHNFKIYKYDPNDSARSSLNFWVGRLVKNAPGGQIWFSEHKRNPNTPYLLAQYDFKTDRFKKYALNLQGTVVRRRKFDKDRKTIWLGTWEKGLISFNHQTSTLEKYSQDHPDSVIRKKRNNIVGIIDHGPHLILSTLQGFWKFDKQTKLFSRPLVSPKDTSFLYNNTIYDIIESPINDPDDNWIVNHDQHQLVRLNKDLESTKRFTLPVRDNFIYIDRDKEGIFWFASQGNGLYRFDPRDDSFLNIVNIPGDPNSLRDNFLQDVFVDRDQNIWVGSNQGMSKLRKQNLKFYNVELKDSRLDASAVFHTKGGEYILIGKKKDNQEIEITAAKFNPRKFDSLQFRLIVPPIKGLQVHDFCQGKNNYWISLFGTGILQIPIDPLTGWLKPNAMKVLAPVKMNPTNSIGGSEPQTIWEDEYENLWVADFTSGICKINSHIPYGETGSVIHFTHSEKDSSTLISNGVYHLIPQSQDSLWIFTLSGVDLLINQERIIHAFKKVNDAGDIRKMKDGTLYYGSLGGGLSEIKLKKNRFYLEPIEFFKNREVVSLQEDRLGRLWVFNTEGVVCYDRKEQIVVRFNERDGFLHRRAIQDWMAEQQTKDGVMVIRDRDGLTIFDPQTFQVNKSPTSPVLSGIKVNNLQSGIGSQKGEVFFTASDITVLHELVLDYQHNNFTLEFSAMEMTAPEKNLYRHMLEGYDPDWIETDYRNRTATYTNLPDGEYTFHVKTSNHHGVWSDNERTLNVIILPPPWRTWWAYLGYGLLVAGLLYWARSNIVQRERLKSNLAMARLEQEKEHFELEKAKEIDKVKTSFFTNISHEFRTPLTLIKGPVHDLLEQYSSDPKTQEKLKLVQRNSELLLKLINQLLDLAKLESGSLKLEKTKGYVFSFVRAIVSSFESFSQQKGVSIRVDVPTEDCAALFDKDKLDAILINLVNNAIKFTPAYGSVSVIAWVNKNQLHLSVKDTGIGIPKEHQYKIFERFHQVSEAHKEVGTGIGLALVKELVALMEGEISVTSEVGKGSEFKVLLPVELVEGYELRVTSPEQNMVEPQFIKGITKLEPRSSEPETRNPELATILIVEDNTDLRHFIIDSLGNEFQFLEAENGKHGLEKATTEVPDLIVSDVMMPEMDGITMTERVKKDIRSCHIPVILLTAKSTEDSKIQGLEHGADDYLTKPFNKNELLLKVRNNIALRIKLREKVRSELMDTVPKVHLLSKDEQFMIKVKETILKRLADEQLSVESLAEDIGLSRVQLYRKINSLTGISVNELIRKLRLQKAAQLLEQNWGPISQVAYEVGFSNLSYFSKVFKEEFGALPSDFKSSH